MGIVSPFGQSSQSVILTPSFSVEWTRLYPMSKTAKATTAKSLSTLSSFPSHACATWPVLYLCKRKIHIKEYLTL